MPLNPKGIAMALRNYRSRTFLGVAMAVCAAAGSLSLTATAQQDIAIPSTTADALPPPETWNCDTIAREYGAWLNDGNTPESWKYVGPTWRDVSNGKTYDWNNWLDWHRSACAALPGEPSGVPDNAMLIGGIVGALTITALAAGSGGGSSGNDSPG